MDPNHYDQSRQLASTPTQQTVAKNEPASSHNPPPASGAAPTPSFNDVGRTGC